MGGVLQRPPPGTIPDAPGSYQFRDRDGRVIYVGKAKSLRSRLSNYFQNPAHLQPRTAQMVASAESVEWIQVRNDVEALMLEYSLIKQHKPRFNVRLTDDKSYPFLAVTVGDEWPRATVRRGSRDKGSRYFGPYAHAYAIRETLDSLLRTFPIRTCSDGKFRNHQRQGRPCLLHHIEKCSGPCVGAVDADVYQGMVGELMGFLGGDTQPVVRRLEAEMDEAAGSLEFERAARLRDRLLAVRKAIEKQQMVTERSEDLDCFGLVDDELEAAVQVFYVRRGRVVGRKGFIVDKVDDLDAAQFVAQVVEQHYADAPLGVPPLVLVPTPPEDGGVLEEWLATQRAGFPVPEAGGPDVGSAGGGGPGRAAVGEVEWWAADSRYRVERSVNPEARSGLRVELRVPQRGEKKALLEMVTSNAAEELSRHRLRRASDHNARARALRALQEALDLPIAPLRIECYDMSHLQGTDYVGSMVVFEDGLAKKADYRKFKVKTVLGNDDYAAMEEVLTRRLTAMLEERASRDPRAGPGQAGTGADLPVTDVGVAGRRSRRRFAYPPQLLLIDGGKGQLGVGERVVSSLGLGEEIELAALAKQFEEVYRPGSGEPVRIPRGSDALYLLQRVRDEAHRFAVTYHRHRRGARMTASALDGIPGLGPSRRARLLKETGGMRALRSASVEDLRRLSWLPDAVAEATYAGLHDGPARRPGGRDGTKLGETGQP
jgi:excinuclease ABC subunit C